MGAGALDISAAIINTALHGRGPVLVLQSVAGGLLGRQAYQGGLKTAALGLVLHFLIATTWTTIYYVASNWFRVLAKQPLIYGPLYGIAVYLFMYGVVMRLSALHFKFFTQSGTGILTAVLIHIFCVGLPIALVVRRYSN